MLDVRRLTLLATVVEAGSMTAAAEALNYTPSAVSQQLRKLEEEVGQPLLHRHSRGVSPTDAGALLAARARRIERSLAAAEADLADVAGLRRGELHIGSFPTAGSSLLPLVVRRFRSLYPKVQLSVRSARLDGLVAMLEEGAVGLSLLWDYEWDRVAHSDFSILHLLDDPTELLVAKTHRLADHETVSMEDLVDEEWIVRGGNHPVVEVLRRSCSAAGFTPSVSFEANDYQEAQAMVSVGLGVALAPRTALANRHPDVKALPVLPHAPERRILVAFRKDRMQAPAEAAMIETMLAVAQGWPTGLAKLKEPADIDSCG